MNEETRILDKKPMEIRPSYTMDVMRLVTINELSKFSDTFYIQIEAGNRQRIIPFRATLRVLFSKIKRFCSSRYPNETEKLKEAFKKVDDNFDFEYINKNTEEKYIKAKRSLTLIKELIDEIIDEIWVKSYDVLTEDQKATLYATGRA